MKLKVVGFLILVLLLVIGLILSNNVFAEVTSGGRSTPAALDPDVNIRLRGYDEDKNVSPTTVIEHPENTDPKAPQLSTLFGNSVNTNPSFGTFYKVKAIGGGGPDLSNTSNPGMVEMKESHGTEVRVPLSGYTLGGDFSVVVLYASETDIVLHWVPEDKVSTGYTLHVLNIFVNPEVRAAYDANEATGRKQLVGLPCKALIGIVGGNLGGANPWVSIRDTGSFMDPRFRDWWNQPLSQDCKNIGPGLVTATEPQDFQLKEVPCDNDKTDPEFHSLRPYPANPCLKKVEDTTLFCGNDLIVKKTIFVQPSNDCTPAAADGSRTCKYKNLPQESSVAISIPDAQLPIMGNTEDVPNATWTSTNTNAANLTAAQRMNNYVSWYLNGVINRAEEDFSAYDPNYLINFSGPLNKLLPWAGQEIVRFVSIDNAKKSLAQSPEVSATDTTARHNQIVGCTFPGAVNGGTWPMPCYLFTIQNLIPIAHAIDPNIDVIIEKAVLDIEKRLAAWQKPPLESDYFNSTFADYWKQYLTWRGKICSANLFGTQFYICAGIPSSFNLFSMFFKNIPSSTTEDRKGEIGTDKSSFGVTTDPATGKALITPLKLLAHTEQTDPQVSEVQFVPDTDSFDGQNSSKHSLYFAHMQEDAELATLLQNTFRPSGQQGFSGIDSGDNYNLNDFYSKDLAQKHCEIQDARTNPGDKLYGDVNRQNEKGIMDTPIKGTLKFNATFECTFKPKADGTIGKCEHEVVAGVAIYTRTPLAQENWERLVGGTQSIFKRIFPKVGIGSPLEKIRDDIPAVTNATYSSTSGDTVLAGNPASNRSGTNAQMFFPYIGGIQKYFLQCIQKALRPKTLSLAALTGQQIPESPLPAKQCEPNDSAHENHVASSTGRNTVITDGVIALALKVSRYTCTPAEVLIGVLAQESQGINYTNFDKNNLQSHPIIGDPNEIVPVEYYCQNGYDLSRNSCGPYSWTLGYYQNVYNHGDNKAVIDNCIANLGISTELNPTNLGQAMCATGANFWRSAISNGLPRCTGSNQKAYTKDEVSPHIVQLMLLGFYGGTTEYGGFDKVGAVYNSLIDGYSKPVADVRGECSSPATNTSSANQQTANSTTNNNEDMCVDETGIPSGSEDQLANAPPSSTVSGKSGDSCHADASTYDGAMSFITPLPDQKSHSSVVIKFNGDTKGVAGSRCEKNVQAAINLINQYPKWAEFLHQTVSFVDCLTILDLFHRSAAYPDLISPGMTLEESYWGNQDTKDLASTFLHEACHNRQFQCGGIPAGGPIAEGQCVDVQAAWADEIGTKSAASELRKFGQGARNGTEDWWSGDKIKH